MADSRIFIFCGVLIKPSKAYIWFAHCRMFLWYDVLKTQSGIL